MAKPNRKALARPPRTWAPKTARKAALQRRGADLIRRVYEVDPLVCDRRGGHFRVVAFITDSRVIREGFSGILIS